MDKTHVVRDLAQARLLADPFRLRVLHAFAAGDRTVKEVAEELDQAPTRLYRHLHALRQAGLVRVVGRRKVRGTVEHRYQAIATRFEVDASLLGRPARRGGRSLPARLLDQAADELADRRRPDRAVILRVQARLQPADLYRLRRTLVDWARSVERAEEEARGGRRPQGRAASGTIDEAECGPGEGELWAATLAFYPI